MESMNLSSGNSSSTEPKLNPSNRGKTYLGGIKEPNVEESFRKRLLWLMQAYQYTARDVAGRIGVAPEVVEAWTEGRRDPTLKGMVALARLFNTDVESLVN